MASIEASSSPFPLFLAQQLPSFGNVSEQQTYRRERERKKKAPTQLAGL